MNFLVDIFGYLTVVLHGVSITAEALTVGGIAFLALVAAPFASQLGETGRMILKRTQLGIGWSALGLVAAEVMFIGLQLSVLIATTGLEVTDAMGASFVIAGGVKIGAALVISFLALTQRLPVFAGVALGLVIGLASTTASHAAAQIDGRLQLGLFTLLHRLGASVWIGGIPYFYYAMNRLDNGAAWRLVGRRFSLMSMAAVATIGLAGFGLAYTYIGSWSAFYGTAYGVMVMTKMVLFAMLLALGALNYKVVEHLRFNPMTPILRLKRCAEVEIGIGITIFFCAASITSLPPAADLTTDRVSLHEIAERMTPQMPRLTSPEHGDLAIPALQAKLDAEAAVRQSSAQEAFTPGAGLLPPRNAEDIAWSEYNHHWAGVMVLIIGCLALIERMGFRPARHWPLFFLVLALFLLLRSDPEVWPLGTVGLLESLRDPEVVQHRFFVLAIILFGVFEWRVRTGRVKSQKAALVFPLVTAVGSALLLTHQHAISNVKDQLLIELTHTPLAVLGVTAAWARWLEIRMDGRAVRIAGYVWPICFILISFILLSYREA